MPNRAACRTGARDEKMKNSERKSWLTFSATGEEDAQTKAQASCSSRATKFCIGVAFTRSFSGKTKETVGDERSCYSEKQKNKKLRRFQMFCQIEKILCFKLDSKYKYKKLNFFSTFFPIFFFVQNVQIQIFFFFCFC